MFLCVNSTPVWYDFRAAAKAIWKSVNIAYENTISAICSSPRLKFTYGGQPRSPGVEVAFFW